MKITVVGCGYVGMSLSVLLAKLHDVTVLDISSKKIGLIKNKISPIRDNDIEDYLINHKLSLTATLDKDKAYDKAEYVIVATPTSYDKDIGSFDTSSVESVISDCLNYNKSATIVIKSTVPLGFTEKMKNKFKTNNIFFSPEFLRESNSLYDNLYPSRIVLGDHGDKIKKFADILIDCANKDQIPVLFMNSTEAEAVKLFSNTFLAMRVSFFNELDSFAENKMLSSRNIIEGVSSDTRIGNHYNNPSFGYGGYCLPKDTKQLSQSFNKTPNNLIKAVVESNKTRKDFIVNSILKKKPEIVGIYRLIMKEGSDNFRESAILDIIENLKINKIKMLLYEPYIKEDVYRSISVVKSFDEFAKKSDLIIANRLSNDLINVMQKVYSRDVFNKN